MIFFCLPESYFFCSLVFSLSLSCFLIYINALPNKTQFSEQPKRISLSIVCKSNSQPFKIRTYVDKSKILMNSKEKSRKAFFIGESKPEKSYPVGNIYIKCSKSVARPPSGHYCLCLHCSLLYLKCFIYDQSFLNAENHFSTSSRLFPVTVIVLLYSVST